MLGFNDQYNVLHGIYITFSSNNKKRLLVSNHKADARNTAKLLYPYRRYESWTKENLVLLGLEIMLHKNPSSFHGMLQYMIDDENDKKVKYFKDIIINYKSYINEDVEKINVMFGEKPTFNQMFQLYSEKKIKFYTLWWFLKYSGEDIDSICKMRIKGSIIKRIKQMNLFLTFKESNLEVIKKTLQEKLNLDEEL
jgi:hypothetical protein